MSKPVKRLTLPVPAAKPSEGALRLQRDRARGRAPRTAADVTHTPIQWLWRGYLPCALVGLYGRGGVGKTTVALDLMARVSSGTPMPDDTPSRHGPTVGIFGTEDSDSVIRQRFESAGGDPAQLILEQRWNFPRDAERLHTLILEYGVQLVVIDPVKSFMSGLDDTKGRDVRQLLDPLAAVASETTCTVAFIRHPKKGAGLAAEQGAGSQEWTNVARQQLTLGSDPAEPGRMLMASSKANYGAPPLTRVYVLDCASGGMPVVRWDGVSNLTADDLTFSEKRPPRPRDDAVAYLLRTLAHGPKPVAQVKQEAESLGIAEITLKRARKQLKVRAEQDGQRGQWIMSLPEK